ncbi:TIGR01440 family protein [uncultured Limosilactobacillus sp.]|uniref:TIGR01440 family protein n=1 Tax=uncultured Limosilactobacillus sp. TaxID=2837629 RepID=UPI0025D7146C|nr:TIGR01440 family protein [uncultured Limosilactobacillus sp.]
MTVNLAEIKQQVTQGVNELLEEAHLQAGDTFVLGISTSEVAGVKLSGAPSVDVGRTIVNTLVDILSPLQINLAVEGCAEINRALTVERQVAEEHHWEIVTVYPSVNASGAAQIAAFERFEDPVEVEHITAQAGMDIGDCDIGMHVQFVQIPVRTSIQTVGQAHTRYLRSRPKLVGGERAKYTWKPFS